MNLDSELQTEGMIYPVTDQCDEHRLIHGSREHNEVSQVVHVRHRIFVNTMKDDVDDSRKNDRIRHLDVESAYGSPAKAFCRAEALDRVSTGLVVPSIESHTVNINLEDAVRGDHLSELAVGEGIYSVSAASPSLDRRGAAANHHPPIIDVHFTTITGLDLLELRGGGPRRATWAESQKAPLGAGIAEWLEDSDYEDRELCELERRRQEDLILGDDPGNAASQAPEGPRANMQPRVITGQRDGKDVRICMDCHLDLAITEGGSHRQCCGSWVCDNCMRRACTLCRPSAGSRRITIRLADHLDGPDDGPRTDDAHVNAPPPTPAATTRRLSNRATITSALADATWKCASSKRGLRTQQSLVRTCTILATRRLSRAADVERTALGASRSGGSAGAWPHTASNARRTSALTAPPSTLARRAYQ